MKQRVSLASIILGSLMVILLLLIMFLGPNRYFLVVVAYIAILAILWIEKDPAIYNLDRLSVSLFVITAIFPISQKVNGEIYWKISVFILAVILLITIGIKWRKIPKTDLKWVLIGFLSSCLILIPGALIEVQYFQKYADYLLRHQNDLGYQTIGNIFTQLSYVTPYEELIFRGALWGELRKREISDKKIFWIQGVLFWLVHFSQIIEYPLSFLLAVPLATLLVSLLTKYSKQLFPSIVAHTICNALLVNAVNLYMIIFIGL